MRFYLVGMPGCGKSTFGKRLSFKTGYEFIDLDIEIEKNAGNSIPEIFEKYGEDRFREIESVLLRRITDSHENFIMATGGGTPCFFDNMDFMNTQGITFYLKADPEQLKKRFSEKGIKKRPLLKHLDNNSIIKALHRQLETRSSYYNRAKYIFTYHENMDQDMYGIILRTISEKESE